MICPAPTRRQIFFAKKHLFFCRLNLVTYVTLCLPAALSSWSCALHHDFLSLCSGSEHRRAERQAIVCIAAGVNFVILTEGWLISAIIEVC
jgi:hypothetical protein